MELLKLRTGEHEWNRYRHIVHPGTWNANPVNAAAGIAMLKVVAKGEVQKQAESMAEQLVAGLNYQIEKRGVEACAYSSSSMIHLHFGKCHKCDRKICLDAAKSMSPELVSALDMHLLLNGLQLLRGVVGSVSAVHTENDISQTIEAFGSALDDMVAERVLTVST